MPEPLQALTSRCLVLSQAKPQFLDVAERSGLVEAIGRENFFAGDEAA